MQTYLSALKEYGDYPDAPAFPHSQWSWMIGATLEQAFQDMTEPTRENFMESLRSIEGFEAPLMLPDTSVDTTEPVSSRCRQWSRRSSTGQGYDTVETFE